MILLEYSELLTQRWNSPEDIVIELQKYPVEYHEKYYSEWHTTTIEIDWVPYEYFWNTWPEWEYPKMRWPFENWRYKIIIRNDGWSNTWTLTWIYFS